MANIRKSRVNHKLIKQACESDASIDNRVYQIFMEDPRVEHAYCMRYLWRLLNAMPLVVQWSKNPQPNADGTPGEPKPKNFTHNRFLEGVDAIETFFSRRQYGWEEVAEVYAAKRHILKQAEMLNLVEE